MPLTPEEREKLLDDHAAMIEASYDVIPEEDLESLERRIMEAHTDKWLAISKGGAIAVGDSESEALDNLEKLGLKKSDAVTEFVHTIPLVV